MTTCCVLLTLSDFTKLRLKKRPKPSPSPPWFFQYWCQNSFTFFLTYIPHDIFPDDSLCLLTLLLDTPRPTKLLNFHWRQVRRRIFFLISITQSCIYHQVVRWNFCCFFSIVLSLSAQSFYMDTEWDLLIKLLSWKPTHNEVHTQQWNVHSRFFLISKNAITRLLTDCFIFSMV